MKYVYVLTKDDLTMVFENYKDAEELLNVISGYEVDYPNLYIKKSPYILDEPVKHPMYRKEHISWPIKDIGNKDE